jgi:ABC-type antimicrobial peptide transport system permease subunit
MMLSVAFATVALLVAGLGVFAVVSYSVARRTSEIGIRSALGARTVDLYRMVLAGGMAPVAAGLVLAIAGATVYGRILSSLLYEVGPRDPVTIALVAAVVASVALAACLIPARRAARVDPLTALRWE